MLAIANIERTRRSRLARPQRSRACRRSPAAIVGRLTADISKILKAPALTDLADELGVMLVGGTPEQLAHLQESDSAKVIRDAHITLN